MSGNKCLKIQMGVKCLGDKCLKILMGVKCPGDKCLKIQTGVKCIAMEIQNKNGPKNSKRALNVQATNV